MSTPRMTLTARVSGRIRRWRPTGLREERAMPTGRTDTPSGVFRVAVAMRLFFFHRRSRGTKTSARQARQLAERSSSALNLAGTRSIEQRWTEPSTVEKGKKTISRFRRFFKNPHKNYLQLPPWDPSLVGLTPTKAEPSRLSWQKQATRSTSIMLNGKNVLAYFPRTPVTPLIRGCKTR